MEIRRLAVCLAFFVLAVSQCSEGHSMRRRDADDDIIYDDGLLADEAGDEDTLNDTDNADSSSAPEQEPSVILTSPNQYKVKAGETQRLECKVSPDNGTVVQWFKNNDLYFFGNNALVKEDRYSLAPNSKDLIIQNAQKSDSGVFRCEILQLSPVNVSHTLLVTEKPVVTSMTASNGGIVVEGSELTLTCHVTGSPPPTVMWSRSTQSVPQNERLTERDSEFSVSGNNYSMYINSIKPEEAGQYYCYAINDIGNHQAETTIVVHLKPRVHVPRTVINSDLNIEAILQCTAHEDPRPHLRWYKDGKLIEDSSSNYKISTLGPHSNLTVTPTTDGDFGTFTCEAENSFGKHNRSIDLVQAPVVENLEIDGAKLTWIVHSHQPIEEMELELRPINQGEEGDWMAPLPVPLPQSRNNEYAVTYLLQDKQLESGDYQAVIKVKNTKSWGGTREPFTVHYIDDQPQSIQHASVFRPSSGHSVRPEYTILSTIQMYVFVRMLTNLK